MKWKKFRIKTITDAEDIIISTLYDIGLEGAQIEDKVPLTAAEKAVSYTHLDVYKRQIYGGTKERLL